MGLLAQSYRELKTRRNDRAFKINQSSCSFLQNSVQQLSKWSDSANNEESNWKLYREDHRWTPTDLHRPVFGKPVHLLHGNPCPLLPSLPCPRLANCSHGVWHRLAFYHSCGQESSRDLKAGPGGPRDLGPDSCSKGGLPRSHQARLHDLQLLCDQLLASNGKFCTIQNV